MKLDSVLIEETASGSGLWLWYARSGNGQFIAHGSYYGTCKAAIDAAISVFDLTRRNIPIYVRHSRLA